jgi:hypothetical protein
MAGANGGGRPGGRGRRRRNRAARRSGALKPALRVAPKRPQLSSAQALISWLAMAIIPGALASASSPRSMALI